MYNKTAYDKIASDPDLNWGSGFYLYYIAHGFKFFGFDKYEPVQKGLQEFEKILNGQYVDIYGVEIPVTYVTSEPILHHLFELNYSKEYKTIADRIYLVQELRYNDTGKYTAFTEGANNIKPKYIYEWIVEGSPNKLWTVTAATPEGLEEVDIPPIIYVKAAIGFLALYDSEYALNMCKYLASKVITGYGFYEGVDETGRVVTVLTDKTNSMIISAVRYAFIHKQKYNLMVKVYDYDGINPISNALVHVNDIVKATDEEGIALFTNISGYVRIYVEYLGVNVTDLITITITSNTELSINASIYDVDFYIEGMNNEAIVNVSLTLALNNRTMFNGKTNDEGFIRFEDIPQYTYILIISSSKVLYQTNITVSEDEEIFHVYLKNTYSNITVNFEIILSK